MAAPRQGARRGALAAAGLLWLARAEAPGARAEGPPASEVPFLDGTTRYCVEALVADPGCCRDGRQSAGVESMDISRAGASWRCTAPADGGDCLDSRPGPRGEDRLWWPRESDCSTPRVLYVHGGEWRSHGPSQGSYDVLASKLADASGALVFVPDYRLVPVGNASDALRGLLEAWRWLSSHGPGGRDCGAAEPPPLLVGGDSAGAGTGLSLVLMLTGKVDAGPPAAGYFGYSPWLNLACTTPTYYSNAFAAFADDSGDTDYIGDIFHRGMPGRTSAEQRALALAYVAGIEDMLTDAIVSPFFATEELLGALPPLYLALSGSEARAGDSVVTAARAAQQGVPVIEDLFQGMWSGFPLYSEGCGSGADLWQGRAALERTGDFVRQASELSRARPNAPRGRRGSGGAAPQVNILYDHPAAARPWLQVPPLSLASVLPPDGGGCGRAGDGAGAAGRDAARAPAPAWVADGAAVAFQGAWPLQERVLPGARAEALPPEPEAPRPALEAAADPADARGARPEAAVGGQRLRSALEVTNPVDARGDRPEAAVGDDAGCTGCGVRPYVAGAVIGSAATLALLAVARRQSDRAGSLDALGVLLECCSALALPACKAHEYERIGSSTDVLRGEQESYECAPHRELDDLLAASAAAAPAASRGRAASPRAASLEPAGAAGWSYGGQGAPELWRRSEAPAWTPRRREEAERLPAAGGHAPDGWSLLSLLPEALRPAATATTPPARSVAAVRRAAAPGPHGEPRCASRSPAPGRSPRGAFGGGASPRRFVEADAGRFVAQHSPRWGASGSPRGGPAPAAFSRSDGSRPRVSFAADVGSSRL